MIRTESGERGWAPAWFIGKLGSGQSGAEAGTNQAQPITAAPSALGAPGPAPSTGSTASGNDAGKEVEIA